MESISIGDDSDDDDVNSWDTEVEYIMTANGLERTGRNSSYDNEKPEIPERPEKAEKKEAPERKKCRIVYKEKKITQMETTVIINLKQPIQQHTKVPDPSRTSEKKSFRNPVQPWLY